MASPSVLTLEDINVIELKTLKAVFDGFKDVLRDKGARMSRVFPKVVSFHYLPAQAVLICVADRVGELIVLHVLGFLVIPLYNAP